MDLQKKRKANGTVDKYKARLVIKGFRQREGLDYFDTYSFVTRITLLRMILAISALRNLEVYQIDVKNAFLNGDLEEEIYTNQPEGFMTPGLESKVYRLVKMTNTQTPPHATTVVIPTGAPATNTVANHAERPEKFNGQNFKRWQQKMFFYLTTLGLARFLKETVPQVEPPAEDRQNEVCLYASVRWYNLYAIAVKVVGNESESHLDEPHDSNADDRRLIAPDPKKDYPSSESDDHVAIETKKTKSLQDRLHRLEPRHLGAGPNVGNVGPTVAPVSRVDTSTTTRFGRESEESNGENVVENRNPSQNSKLNPLETRAMAWDEAERAKYMASQEPSRSATPVRATTPAARSPIASGSTTPVRAGLNLNPLETRAMAWDEAVLTKYIARFKQEEVKIQAWENHEKKKAEMEMKIMEIGPRQWWLKGKASKARALGP
ncbi:remorin [Tanacetum coccineum]|uniref:Remorin n=1 Tax=Tanacetum coccineum TaxID=301880 RepID=A0ABQ5ANI8_9ASTR